MVRKRTKKELFDKFGTDSYKYYASREAVKGLEFGQELLKKHPSLKYWRIPLMLVLVIIIILFIKLIIWIGGII